ncbi:TUNICAMYCIN INDUCED 1 isoform A [Micractinium conductrix]|uniref:TUNICAMYCIN INDUCED 1 isoform A n=1 Tax=Micractinium conductrix TaxID=554055 RepID=A0A2P6VFN9_9CHLO|nr:TUNICAMYCIN INDUCED 1 isoform A [Micractinium conductrix]|eukprot:PSC72889.1 TUNICAMYCIN INDUCED 1 isoform A [Micractinium conductrix]
MAGALTALTLATLLCGAPAAAAAAAAGTPDELSTELAVLASEGDAAALWRRATASAADAVVEALRKQDPSLSVELKGADLEELRIWHGQTVSLGLEADGQRYKFMVQSEPEWRRLASVLGAAEGGLLPRGDWDSLDRDWLSPVSHGSLLPEFALEGPVDIYLAQPTALQLYLPHASDAGAVRRVLLREGAAVLVRGARSVRLRRNLDLPAISLSEFAGIVAADAAEQQPLGMMHLLTGVRSAAQAHWNASHPEQSLGLVALELDLSPRGAALAAAPGPAGAPSRLRVRRVGAGAIELLARDGAAAATAAAAGEAGEGAVALPSDLAGGADGGGAWPLQSVHPSHLQVVASRLFQGGGGSGGMRLAADVQLRLVETEAEATTLLQVQLELERRPRLLQGKQQAGAAGSEGKQQWQASSGGAAGGGGAGGGEAAPVAAGGGKRSAAAVLAALDEPPGVLEVMRGAGKLGPHETWAATVQVRGDAARGTLRFEPLHLQRVDASADTVQFAPHAFQALLGLANVTGVEVLAM